MFSTLNPTVMHVIGLATRTSLADSLRTRERLWNTFLEQKMDQQIPQRIRPHRLYTVHTDYATDGSGDHLILVGAQTQNGEPPTGLQRLTIPHGSYREFTWKGVSLDALDRGWRVIDQHFTDSSEHRAFTLDYEVQNTLYPDEIAFYIAYRDGATIIPRSRPS